MHPLWVRSREPVPDEPGLREFPVDEIAALASRRSLGTEVSFGDTTLKTRDLDTFDFTGWDIALFAIGSDATKKYAPVAAKAGCVVIDNSSLYRYDPEIPLIQDGDTLLDMMLRRDLRQSYRKEIANRLNEIFAGQDLTPVRAKLEQIGALAVIDTPPEYMQKVNAEYQLR